MWNPNAGQPGTCPTGGPMHPPVPRAPGVTNPINPPSVNPAYPPGTAPPGCFPGNTVYPPGTAYGHGHPPGCPCCPPRGPCPPPGHYPPPGPCVNPLAPGIVVPGIVMDKKMRKKMKKAHKKHKHHKHGKHSSSSSSSSDSD